MEESGRFRSFSEEHYDHLKNFFISKCKKACIDWESCFHQSLEMVISQWERKPPKEWEIFTPSQKLNFLKGSIRNKAITIWDNCENCQRNFVALDDPENDTDLIDNSTYICPYQNTEKNEILEIINNECTKEEKEIIFDLAAGTSSREIGNQLNKEASSIRKIKERVMKRLRKKLSY